MRKLANHTKSLSDKWEKFKGMLPEINYVLFEVTVGADSFNHLAIAKLKMGSIFSSNPLRRITKSI